MFATPSPPSQVDDSQYFQAVVKSFIEYRNHTLFVNQARKKDLDELSVKHQSLLGEYRKKLTDIEFCASKNQVLLNKIVKDEITGNLEDQIASGSNIEKVRSTLRQLVRDWAVEGQEERDACYKPILEALLSEFSEVDFDNRSSLKVLVPGAGLGRLAFEIASLNFSCEGNEFSYHMLLASNFIFNMCQQINGTTIYPWIHSLNNCYSNGDVLAPVRIPDVLPSENLQRISAEFSMSAGEFVEVYGKESQRGKWDAVTTCFFLDTAHNFIEYAETVKACLKPGGVWVNLGPLLWHFEGNSGELSISLSYSEMIQILRDMQFVISDERRIDSVYSTRGSSLMKHLYTTCFFIAKT
ncbi:MAG: hypothetical protein SGCHY_000456 [Lobulomycetales sp.]